jgi:S1-C subfamily serine protease
MKRLARLTALSAALLAAAGARADDKPASPELAALQAAVKKTVAGAESSVGCVLVGRSSHYAKLDPPPADALPGQLGRFDADALLRKLPADDERQRRLIQGLDLSRPDHVPESFGSCVVLDESGLVLTQAHVVRNAAKLYVRFSHKRGSWADVLAADPRSDLAVLRLLDKTPDLKAVKLGDGGKAEKGQFVVLLANTFAPGFRDWSPTASWALIANVRERLYRPVDRKEFNKTRHSHTLYHYPTLLQLDMRLKAVSGGAVFNLDGELIALTTARALEGGEAPGSFALPLDAAVHRIIEVLRRGEEVEYGFLGVGWTTEDRAPEGVKLDTVAEHSPAFRAGVHDNDLLLSIDGVPVREHDDVFLLVGRRLAGTTIKVEVKAGPGEPTRTCTATLAKFYIDGPILASKQPAPRRGLRVDYTSVLNGRPAPSWIKGVAEGVLIRDVKANSPADRAQLQPDKIITKVNGQKVLTPAEFYRAMDRADGRIDLSVCNDRGVEETVTLEEK